VDCLDRFTAHRRCTIVGAFEPLSGAVADGLLQQADHERHVQIAHAAANVASPGGPQHSLPRPNVMDEAVASLYKHNGDLSLKEGQTIRCTCNSQSMCAVSVSVCRGANAWTWLQQRLTALTATPPP
jgi:hypothetical protein